MPPNVSRFCPRLSCEAASTAAATAVITGCLTSFYRAAKALYLSPVFTRVPAYRTMQGVLGSECALVL